MDAMLIGQVLRLTKWEWFKLRRLRMPWILLAVAVLVSQLGIWVNYAAYHNSSVQDAISGGRSSFSTTFESDGEAVSVEVSCTHLVNENMPPEIYQLTEEQQLIFLRDAEEFLGEGVCENFQTADEFRKGFTLPSSITESITSFTSLGPIAVGPLLIMILAASLLGSEYGWGTLRTVLAGGIGRWRFLSAKILLLLRLCSDALIVISVLAVASSLTAALIPPGETGGLADSGRWTDAVIIFFKALYGFLPFIALSVLATVLTSSRGVGIALSVGYFMVESIAAPLLRLNDTLAEATDFLLIQSFRSWTDAPIAAETSDAVQSFVVILAYTVLFVAATSWIFKRRDISGAMGD